MNTRIKIYAILLWVSYVCEQTKTMFGLSHMQIVVRICHNSFYACDVNGAKYYYYYLYYYYYYYHFY